MDIRFLTLLLVCQLIGEIVTAWLALPLPGPVLGMVILFCGLVVRGAVPDQLSVVTTSLLRYLSLLFVPAGVGVMLHASVVAEQWWPLSVALVGSAVCTLVVTAWVMRMLQPRPDRESEL
ncbi:MAG: CidA/LrgA family protein [Gammaproteobacteria bacterium]|nr:CidA/LrgA family protein [Gammaproteobacteria bacterium]